MKSRKEWMRIGILYFSFVFVLLPIPAFAYIDPSVTSYAIQAIAGIVVAAGAFFAAYGRKARKRIRARLGMDENAGKNCEDEVQVYMEDLKQILEEQKAKVREVPAEKKTGRGNDANHGRFLLSLLCGLSLSLTVILQPVLTFYIQNEGEFWFSLGSVIGPILVFTAAVAFLTGLVHRLLPEGKRTGPRLIFSAVVAGICLCFYIQSNFMSSYLPVLTGDAIDWSLYSGWGIASLCLWGAVIIAFVVLAFLRPRAALVAAYGTMALLLCMALITGASSLLSEMKENKKAAAYLSNAGICETSTSGNIVVLISDTLEGTYVNEVLEQDPKLRDTLLYDVTSYNNVTGTSCFTYYSYAKMMTGVDFPMGADSEEGIAYCFNHETILEPILENGWDVSYYSTFAPTDSMEGKLKNYAGGSLVQDLNTARILAGMLVRSGMFRGVPQPCKDLFAVYTADYEGTKALIPADGRPSPYVEDDVALYRDIRAGLVSVDSSPQYSIVQMWGIHEPSIINENFERTDWKPEVSVHDRKIAATKAQLLLLRTYLDQLKAAGTYENTTVIMTADHGFGLRFYPAFLVKEAGREEIGFLTDSAPLSLQEDYADLISAMTTGKRFSDAVFEMNLPENRVRYALDFRATDGYARNTNRRTTVVVDGPAGDEVSYSVEQDEFLLNDDFAGRCQIGTPFIRETAETGNVAVYGQYQWGVYGHTVVFDAFLTEPAPANLQLRMKIRNVTDIDQSILFSLDGMNIDQISVPAGNTESVIIRVPAEGMERITLKLNLPDARYSEYLSSEGENLAWNSYESIMIEEASYELR